MDGKCCFILVKKKLLDF